MRCRFGSGWDVHGKRVGRAIGPNFGVPRRPGVLFGYSASPIALHRVCPSKPFRCGLSPPRSTIHWPTPDVLNLPTPHSAFPGSIWPAVPQVPAAALLAVLEQLDRTQYMEPEQLAAARRPQVEALMDHACAQVPFWEARLRAAGLDPASRARARLDSREWEVRWAALPILTRAEVQDLGEKLRAAKLPSGHGNVGESVTSGSSGRPVRIARSTLDYFYWQAFQLREHLWRRRELSGTFLSVLRNEKSNSFELQRNENWGPPVSVVWPTGPSFLIDYRAPTAAIVDAICEVRPDYLCTFPSLLAEVLRYARDSGRQLPPLREAIGVGEASPLELADLCGEVWSAPLCSTYTAAETGAIAYQCPEAGRWHLQSEKSVIEVIGEDGRNCSPGEMGNVVLTPLHNFAMPLFRYEIGDLATVGEASCRCGRLLPTLDAITGRARDLLMLPSGEFRPPYYGHNAVMRVRAIRQHQVVQTAPDEICFRLVVGKALTCEEERHVVETARDALGPPFSVRIEYVDEIVRRPNGKFAEFERAF